MAECKLCNNEDKSTEEVLFQNDLYRILKITKYAPEFPVYLRVVTQAHKAELTDLDDAARAQLLSAVFCAEKALLGRSTEEAFYNPLPDKINIASFANMVKK